MTTTRAALRFPAGSDPANVPLDIHHLADDVDAIILIWLTGTTAGKPASSKNGRLYYETDGDRLSYDQGTTWRKLMMQTADGKHTADTHINATGYEVAGVALASTHLNDSATLARLADPTFTGNPKAPTPPPGDNDTSIATSAFVQAAITAVLALPLAIVDADVSVGAAIDGSKLANDSVTATQIAANAIGASELADNAVDTAAIAAQAVTAAKIANDTITAAQIATGAVTTAEILDATILGSDIANDTITAAQIAANAIGASELANDAVDTAAIADHAVTQAKVQSYSMSLALATPPQTIPDSSFEVVAQSASPAWSFGGCVASNGIQVPVTGIYDVLAELGWDPSAAGERYIEFYHVDAGLSLIENHAFRYNPSPSGYAERSVPIQLYMAATDHVYCRVWQNTGGDLNLNVFNLTATLRG